MSRPKLEIGFVTIPIAKPDYADEGSSLAWLEFAKEVLDHTCVKLYQAAQLTMEKHGVDVGQLPREEVLNTLRASIDSPSDNSAIRFMVMTEGNIIHDEDAERVFAEGRSFNN